MTIVNYDWDEIEDNIVEEFDDAGTTIAEYTTEPEEFGNVVSQHRGGQDSYYHYDGQGSALSLTEGSGAVTDNYTYSAFGEVIERIGDTVSWVGFFGRLGCVSEAGLSDLSCRRRIYSTVRCRWLSQDPRDGDFASRYIFVSNAPMGFVDPSGEIKVTTTFKTATLKCNDSVPEANFKFELESTDATGKVGAPCVGFIVQKVTVSCSREICPKGCACAYDEKKAESYFYWEAFPIKLGQTSVTDLAGGIPTWADSCGKYTQKGEIKFFCQNRTKVPKGKFKVGTGPLDKKWTQREFGKGFLCTTTTIELPGTNDKDDADLKRFWDKEPVEGPASRSIALEWNCCEGVKTIKFETDPKYQD